MTIDAETSDAPAPEGHRWELSLVQNVFRGLSLLVFALGIASLAEGLLHSWRSPGDLQLPTARLFMDGVSPFAG
ncbi:MAG: hypothetical protein HRU17_17395 [Polyangiaceae bacterium]|nr:hypothetical protein [Polyangiaceae bacterium]